LHKKFNTTKKMKPGDICVKVEEGKAIPPTGNIGSHIF
jgi:hypothetical protein